MPKAKTIKQPTSKAKKETNTNDSKLADQLGVRQPIRRKKLISIRDLSYKSINLLLSNKNLFLGIIIVYAIADFIFIQGITGVLNINNLNYDVSKLFHGSGRQFSGGLTVFGLMVSSFGANNNASGGTYFNEWLLVVLVSLALIWAIKQTIAKRRTTTKESFYRGMSPIIPFVLIILFIGVELLPLLLGVYLYVVATNNYVIVNLTENIGFLLILVALATLSIYFICSSLFALYIVTEPDMTPMKALKIAKSLVKKRRLLVFMRLIFLPVTLLVILAIILIPLIIFAASIAQYIFLLLSFIFLALAHSYFYNLYLDLKQSAKNSSYE